MKKILLILSMFLLTLFINGCGLKGKSITLEITETKAKQQQEEKAKKIEKVKFFMNIILIAHDSYVDDHSIYPEINELWDNSELLQNIHADLGGDWSFDYYFDPKAEKLTYTAGMITAYSEQEKTKIEYDTYNLDYSITKTE